VVPQEIDREIFRPPLLRNSKAEAFFGDTSKAYHKSKSG